MTQSTTIWCNATLTDPAKELLTRDLSPHRILFSTMPTSNLTAAGADPLLAQANIAFGQPDPQQVIDSPNLKWVHLTSAGYTRYDTEMFRMVMRSRGSVVTNSSMVYADPCAEHALAMMMGVSRQLPRSLDEQRGSRGWKSGTVRRQIHLLRGQSVLIYGFGAIAKRLVELLKPFEMKIAGVRRNARGDEGVPMVSIEQADQLLPTTDHVMNILPASPATDHFFDASRLAKFFPAAMFYNIGRGTTVDQDALIVALHQKKFAGAYLDVTTPEPLPPDHALWSLPNCWITPHTAGGHSNESIWLVRHFRDNLDRYGQGKNLQDKVIG